MGRSRLKYSLTKGSTWPSWIRANRDVQVQRVQIVRSGQRRGVTRTMKAMIKRRSAIELTIECGVPELVVLAFGRGRLKPHNPLKNLWHLFERMGPPLVCVSVSRVDGRTLCQQSSRALCPAGLGCQYQFGIDVDLVGSFLRQCRCRDASGNQQDRQVLQCVQRFHKTPAMESKICWFKTCCERRQTDAGQPPPQNNAHWCH